MLDAKCLANNRAQWAPSRDKKQPHKRKERKRVSRSEWREEKKKKKGKMNLNQVPFNWYTRGQGVIRRRDVIGNKEPRNNRAEFNILGGLDQNWNQIPSHFRPNLRDVCPSRFAILFFSKKILLLKTCVNFYSLSDAQFKLQRKSGPAAGGLQRRHDLVHFSKNGKMGVEPRWLGHFIDWRETRQTATKQVTRAKDRKEEHDASGPSPRCSTLEHQGQGHKTQNWVWPIREAYPSLTTLMLKGGNELGVASSKLFEEIKNEHFHLSFLGRQRRSLSSFHIHNSKSFYQ